MRNNRVAATIDEYLDSVDADRRQTLEDLRKKIHAIIPHAEECISYSMPAFRFNGVVVAGFSATTKGGSFYPFSGTTLKTLEGDVGHFEQTKGSLHFTIDKPLSITLVRKLIKTRIAEITSRPKKRRGSTSR
jgi:uncharacterized protein YdhG (YjbR/CyaY superfamily)